MPNYWGEELFSVAFRDEAVYGDFGSGAWTVMEATKPEYQLGRQQIEDLNLSQPADFQMQARVVGGRDGTTITVRAPLRSQLDTYQAPGDTKTTNPELELLARAMGGLHVGTNVDGDVAAGSTAYVWNLTAGTPDEGACYYVGTTDTQDVVSIGWVKDLTPGTPNVATLREDGIGIPATGDDLYGMYTFASNNVQPTSFAFRWKGESDDHDFIVSGCQITDVKFMFTPSNVIVLEFSMIGNSWRYDTASGDGLLSAIDYMRLPPISLENDGRLTIDGESTGTADPEGTCGIGEVTIEISNLLIKVPCHGGPQGVAARTVARRTARVSFPISYTTDYITGTESDWDLSLEKGTTHSIMMQVGDTVGQVFSLYIPKAVVVEQPQFASVENMVAWQVTVEPESAGTTDTGTDFPANTPFRIAVG